MHQIAECRDALKRANHCVPFKNRYVVHLTRKDIRQPMHDTTNTTTGSPSLRYWTAGTQGPKVLLIMGYGMRGDIWEPQINGLKETHQVAWFDNRGIGDSERGPKPRWRMTDMAEDTLSVMDALGWEQCHLVGVSMGGMIAQEVALQAPQRLQSLTLIVTHAGGITLQKLPTRKGLKAFVGLNQGDLNQRIESLKRLLYPPEYLAKADHEALRKRIQKRIGRPLDRATALGQLSAIARHDTRKRLGSVHTPTLIIKAGKDILVRPTASDHLKSYLPDAAFIEIPEAGHGVIFQASERVNEILEIHFSQSIKSE